MEKHYVGISFVSTAESFARGIDIAAAIDIDNNESCYDKINWCDDL
jgi:hypothetical protein